ncbi:MAG: 4Fe-4S binding protein [Clostridiales bacterium]|nr:4Fe-4S binding protein [Clostridiales bacterium]
MIIYYTGTGNSRIVAEKIAEETKDEVMNAFEAIRGKTYENYTSDNPWIFVSPTYGWRLPRIFENFILCSHFSGCRDAYFVMTCGSEIGNAEKHIRSLCDAKDFSFRGVKQINMPENYTAMFPVPDENTLKKIIEAAMTETIKTVEYIREAASIPRQDIGLVDKIKSGIVNEAFYLFCISAKGFRTTNDCISCGRCVNLCPCDNISLVGEKPKWRSECTHCMACINACPQKAIEYKKVSVGKPRIYNGKAR